MRSLLALILLALVSGHPARACTVPVSPQVFAIEHQFFGEIGQQALRFGCWGGQLVVDVEEEIQVKIALVTAFARTAEQRQIWQRGRLRSFRGETNDSDAQHLVLAERRGDGIEIEGRDGRIEAPATVVPDYPWREEIALQPLAFDLDTGELLHLSGSSAGLEELSFGGAPVVARKIAVRGDRVRDLWYDEVGLLKWQLEARGAVVTLTRQAYTPR